jgi:hypothetical protein
MLLVCSEPGFGFWKVILAHTDLGSRSAHADQRVDVELVGKRLNSMFHQLVGDELCLDRIACHVAFDKIRRGRPCKVCERIIDFGSLGDNSSAIGSASSAMTKFGSSMPSGVVPQDQQTSNESSTFDLHLGHCHIF